MVHELRARGSPGSDRRPDDAGEGADRERRAPRHGRAHRHDDPRARSAMIQRTRGPRVSRVRDAWGAWVAFWDRRESPHGLAMVRILLGACLVGDLVNTWARGLVSALYSTAGYANIYATGWSRALGDDPGPIVFAIAFAAAIAMVLGVAT